MADFADVFRHVSSNMARVADSAYIDAVARATDLLQETFASGRKLLVFGNGGSSADAQHLTAELVGRFSRERAPLPAGHRAHDESGDPHGLEQRLRLRGRLHPADRGARRAG
jgi:phosphoheptose isomerase